MDGFSIKYVYQEHTNDLVYVLQREHTISHNKSVKHYLGPNLNWDYENYLVHLFML